MWWQIEGSYNPLLRFCNILEWLTELRKTIYLLDYSFMIKGYNQEQPNGWYAQGREGMGEGTQNFQALSR